MRSKHQDQCHPLVWQRQKQLSRSTLHGTFGELEDVPVTADATADAVADAVSETALETTSPALETASTELETALEAAPHDSPSTLLVGCSSVASPSRAEPAGHSNAHLGLHVFFIIGEAEGLSAAGRGVACTVACGQKVRLTSLYTSSQPLSFHQACISGSERLPHRLAAPGSTLWSAPREQQR